MARHDEESLIVNPIPDNYPRASAALAVDGAADAIEFYGERLPGWATRW